MHKLQCPFTWGVVPLDEFNANHLRDRLPLAVRPWDTVIKKTQLAFFEFYRGNLTQSRTYVTECFLHLLSADIPGVKGGCELTRAYSHALKHILNATWAIVCRMYCKDAHSLDHLNTFISRIEPFDLMSHKQQAAIHAFHSHFVPYPANQLWARKAVELDPKEGQWQFYLASTLLGQHDLEEREKKTGVFRDLLKLNSNCLKLRSDAPEPFIFMAKLCCGDKESAVDESFSLVQQAIKQFPNSAYVHDQAADILRVTIDSLTLHPESLWLIEKYYQKALEIGGECLYVRYKLGLHLLGLSRVNIKLNEDTYTEGIQNLTKAAPLFGSVRDVLKKLQTKDTTFPEVESVKAKLGGYEAKFVATYPAICSIAPSIESESKSSWSSHKKRKPKLKKVR